MGLKVRRIWRKVEELRARVAPATYQKAHLVYDLGSLLFTFYKASVYRCCLSAVHVWQRLVLKKAMRAREVQFASRFPLFCGWRLQHFSSHWTYSISASKNRM